MMQVIGYLLISAAVASIVILQLVRGVAYSGRGRPQIPRDSDTRRFWASLAFECILVVLCAWAGITALLRPDLQ